LGLWATGTERIRLETELMATGALAPQALDLFRKDGSTVPVLLSARMLDLEGEACLLVISQDLTAAGEAEAERRRLELELQHAQKLESLGGLAGGVAHDMNNNLAGILGLSSLLQHQYTADLVLAKGLAGINLLRSTTRQKIDLIGLQSKVGEGTQVVLSFPPLEAERTIPHPEPPPSLPAEMAPLSVLVVDDDPIIQETLPDLLAFLGHATHSATRGQEALDLLATGLEVDLVILDHNMPGLSGAETLVRLRAIRPDLPVLLSTGFLEPGVEALAQRFQKVWLLNKPYSLAAIRAKLVGIAAQRASGFR
jgi:CheY-like chemotaxis protein